MEGTGKKYGGDVQETNPNDKPTNLHRHHQKPTIAMDFRVFIYENRIKLKLNYFKKSTLNRKKMVVGEKYIKPRCISLIISVVWRRCIGIEISILLTDNKEENITILQLYPHKYPHSILFNPFIQNPFKHYYTESHSV